MPREGLDPAVRVMLKFAPATGQQECGEARFRDVGRDAQLRTLVAAGCVAAALWPRFAQLR